MKKNWTREFRNSESASRQFLRVSKKNIWVGRFLVQSVGLPQTKIILRMALNWGVNQNLMRSICHRYSSTCQLILNIEL